MCSKVVNIVLYRYLEIDNIDGIGIWRPIITFGRLLNYEKAKVYGGDKPFSFWYINYKKIDGNIVYQEEIKLSFTCPFNFENYPFDSHVCTLEFGCPLEPIEKLRLEPSRIIYGHVLQHSLGENPIILSDLPYPFEFEFKIKPAFKKININNYATSHAGMEIKMKRRTIGELLSGYYYPMAAFAFLSMISFLINPDVVSCNCYFH